MTHLSPANAVRLVLPTVSDADSSVSPLIGNHHSPEAALSRKRAQVAQLESAWVAAAEAEVARHLSHGARVDDRATWDKTMWDRYLAAATAQEPNFKAHIMHLLDEIGSLERLLAVDCTPVHLARRSGQRGRPGERAG
jgi:hypothetical protein